MSYTLISLSFPLGQNFLHKPCIENGLLDLFLPKKIFNVFSILKSRNAIFKIQNAKKICIHLNKQTTPHN